MFSSLPAQAQRTTWSPLRASKEPFQYHASSHTVQTQPDLVGQQDHHTSRRSSTRALPTSHSARIRCRSTHTSLEVQHSSGGAACDQAQWRCPLQVLCFIQPLQVSESSVSAAHPAAPALSCPAWVMPTVWHGKHVLSANIIHSLIKPLWKGGFLCDLLRVICTDLLRCSSGCCHSILSAKETGKCCGEGNGFCRKNWLHWCILRSASPLELPSPPLQHGRQSELGASLQHLLPGSWECWRNTPAVQWEPTSPSQAVQTYLDLKETAHCYQNHESLTGVSCPPLTTYSQW